MAAVFSKLGVPIKTTVAPMVWLCQMPSDDIHACAALLLCMMLVNTKLLYATSQSDAKCVD